MKGLHLSVDVITNHKNLTYFSTTKILTRHQAHWSEYLSQFNLIVYFHLGHLRAKPDALTRCSDVYPKGENSGYTNANLYNFRPIFTLDQLSISLHTIMLFFPVLCSVSLFDLESLLSDICSSYSSNPLTITQLSKLSTPSDSLDSSISPTVSAPASSHWALSPSNLLLLNGLIYVPDSVDLYLKVLRQKHNHLLSGYLGQTKTMGLIHREFDWPGLHRYVRDYIKFCTTCMHSKS